MRGRPNQSSLRRQLTITLEEDDWKKFLELTPEPTSWIVQKIREYNAREKGNRNAPRGKTIKKRSREGFF